MPYNILRKHHSNSKNAVHESSSKQVALARAAAQDLSLGWWQWLVASGVSRVRAPQRHNTMADVGTYTEGRILLSWFWAFTSCECMLLQSTQDRREPPIMASFNLLVFQLPLNAATKAQRHGKSRDPATCTVPESS